MRSTTLTTLWVLTVFIVTAGCNKQTSQGHSLQVPAVGYSISQLSALQSFQGKVVSKHIGSYPGISIGITNFFFTILLEKANGEQLVLSDNPTSQHLFQLVNSLEKDHNYTFPDVLINGSQSSVAH